MHLQLKSHIQKCYCSPFSPIVCWAGYSSACVLIKKQFKCTTHPIKAGLLAPTTNLNASVFFALVDWKHSLGVWVAHCLRSHVLSAHVLLAVLYCFPSVPFGCAFIIISQILSFCIYIPEEIWYSSWSHPDQVVVLYHAVHYLYIVMVLGWPFTLVHFRVLQVVMGIKKCKIDLLFSAWWLSVVTFIMTLLICLLRQLVGWCPAKPYHGHSLADFLKNSI